MDKIVFENVSADRLLTLLGPVAGLGGVSGMLVKVESDDVSLRVIDPAHVAMAYSSWMVHTGQSLDVGIDYEQTMTALRLFAGQDVRLTITDGDITIKGANGRRVIPRLDPEVVSAPCNIPTFDLPVSVLTTISALKASMKCVQGLSDHVSIRAGADGPAVMETATDRTSASFTIEGTARNDTGADAVSTYAWDYFESLVKATSDGPVVISYNTDFPMMMVADRDDIQQQIMIAPRIETE